MFQFLFKYPFAAYRKGSLVLLSGWPVWALAAAALAAGGVLGWLIWKRRGAAARGLQPAILWLLQTALVALILLLLWHPALSVATLAPQQNIIAVVVDDSRSMDVRDMGGKSRRERMTALLEGGLLEQLRRKFQVRLFRLDAGVERMEKLAEMKGGEPATRIGTGLQRLMEGFAALPVGAVVLLSDGADNAGGIDAAAMAAIRQRRIPVQTVGFGKETIEDDVELAGVDLPAKVMAGSRVEAVAAIRQAGFEGRRARLTVRGNGRVLASRDITLDGEGKTQTERVPFNAGPAGMANIEVGVEPLEGERNRDNNKVTRAIPVDGTKRRILYVEGEPRWEFKFLRRAVEDDPNLQIVSMLRTTQNKIYRQGISNPKELEKGFPAEVEELFGYDGIILGSVEAGYFTGQQRETIGQFVDRRGGGLLFLAGRFTLTEGGYEASPFPDLLPVILPRRTGQFQRDPATASLTAAGRDSLICRIEDDPEKNVARWKTLPYLANYQNVGTPKPGALELAEMTVGKTKLPLLVTENYGRGRTAVFATAGSWRWQMLQPVEDLSHETFWRQLLRWLVTETPSRVVVTAGQPVVNDTGEAALRVEVRDTTYLPASDASVEVHVTGPDGTGPAVALAADARQPGIYTGAVQVAKPGSYAVEAVAKRGAVEVGRSVAAFRREDGVAENFHQEQNRELLEKLASETGGRYYTASNAGELNEEITLSNAGMSVRQTLDLWDMPALFLLALALRATEWLLRRRWGFV